MIRTSLWRLSRPLAWAVACATLTLIVTGLFELRPVERTTHGLGPATEASDWELYRAVFVRLENGEDYYSALGDELRAQLPDTLDVLLAHKAMSWLNASIALLRGTPVTDVASDVFETTCLRVP